ncbi:MAG: DUF2339 domain-containing protein [SAR202 cluster bacterium]|jgi:uncharacterized membrane protein|nr:DUF2339 domain-containing protein [Dehalococcoidia bacterium]MDP7613578.1 DUF2339 domain-containing protein [Dehalococcoidia bacterium]MQG47418.1 DUF2339 domain-containing protein [SAR202 cluster bacterium]|tara:strand:- start:1097 stop:3466 length:2370 start_codon:yes stop_codon:yes gene_type:complete
MITCPKCQFQNKDEHHFCISCGSTIKILESASPVSREEFNTLRSHVDSLRQALISRGIKLEESRQENRPTKTSQKTPSQQATPKRINLNIEKLAGINWLAIIGSIAVVLGIGFLFKLAVDNSWINELIRVIVGILTGILLWMGGQFWRLKYPPYALALTGGGSVVLYVTFLAAFTLYGYFGIYYSSLFLLATSIVSVFFALRHDSIYLALLAVIGAFVGPFIIGPSLTLSGGPGYGNVDLYNVIFLLVYIIVVEIGVLIISGFRHWNKLNLAGVLGAFGTYVVWFLIAVDWPSGLEDVVGISITRIIAQLGLTGIFLGFLASTIVYQLVRKINIGRLDFSLVILVPNVYMILSYVNIWDEVRHLTGLFTVLLSVLYFCIGVAAFKVTGFKLREIGVPHRSLTLTLIMFGLSFMFLTVALPVQFGANYVGLAWAVECFVIMFISMHLRVKQFRYGAMFLYLISFIYIGAFRTPELIVETTRDQLDLIKSVGYIMGFASLVGTAFLYRKYSDSIGRREIFAGPVAAYLGIAMLIFLVPTQVYGAWVAFGWAFLSLLFSLVGVIRRVPYYRIAGLIILLIAGIRAITYDSYFDEQTFKIFINTRSIAFLPTIIAAGFAFLSFSLWRLHDIHVDLNRILKALSLVAANILFVWFLSAEVIGLVNSDSIFTIDDKEKWDAKSLGLTALWSTYSVVVLVVGLIAKNRTIRLVGLFVLGIPVLKLFLFDSFQLALAYRVIAFLVLGCLLLTTAYLYQRFRDLIKRAFMPSKIISNRVSYKNVKASCIALYRGDTGP